jgi:hypothetical protein
MLKFEEGIDIVQEIGLIKTVDEARRLFEEKMEPEQFRRMAQFENPARFAQDRQCHRHVPAGSHLYQYRLRGGPAVHPRLALAKGRGRGPAHAEATPFTLI